MKEQTYQKKIITDLEKFGGYAVNGIYTKDGEADLQTGYPVNGILQYLVIEVKTKHDYERVMSGIEDENGIYQITNVKKLKPHEPLQIHKINLVRRKGGLGLVAYCFKQVQEYVNSVRSLHD